MLNIISHRGFWKVPEEQNTQIAFQRSLESGYGIETDIRDIAGELVISHDMPENRDHCQSLDSFLYAYNDICKGMIDKPALALNIKSDGMQAAVRNKIIKHNISNYFVFDMSIPQTLAYLDSSLIVFARQSEYEPGPCLLKGISGIWLDQFVRDWCDKQMVLDILNSDLDLCIVSPELHKRDYRSCWLMIKQVLQTNKNASVSICTDFPDKA